MSVTLFGETCNRLLIATWKVFTIIVSVRLESCACCSQHNSRCSSASLNKHHYHHRLDLFTFEPSHPRCSNFPLIHISPVASFTRQGRRIAWKIRSLCQSIFVFARRMPGSDGLHFPAATANWFTVPKVNCIYLNEAGNFCIGLKWVDKFRAFIRTNKNTSTFIKIRRFPNRSQYHPPNSDGNNKKEKHFHSRSKEKKKTFAMCMASEIKKSSSSSKNNISVARSLSLATVVLVDGLLNYPRFIVIFLSRGTRSAALNWRLHQLLKLHFDSLTVLFSPRSDLDFFDIAKWLT